MTLSDEPTNEIETDVAAPDLDASRGSINIVGGTDDVGDEALRLRLEKFIAAHPQLTTVELSRSDHIGQSRTALDSYLAGKYFLSEDDGGMGVNPQKSRLELKIRRYLDKVEGTERHGYSTAFTETVLWKQFQYACNTAIAENIIVLAYGSPGHGKSRSLLQYQANKLTTLPIEILCSPNITTGYFIRKIARELKISEHGIIPDLEDKIAEKLIHSGRPMIIDQANYLSEKALGTICYLWERARIGVVLVGTEELHRLFTSLSGREDVRAQLSSRVALMVPLKGLSVDEAKGIINKALGKYATAAAIAQIYNITAGNFRHLGFLLPRLAATFNLHADEIERGELDTTVLINNAATRMLID